MVMKKINHKTATRIRKSRKKKNSASAIKTGTKTKSKATQFVVNGQVLYSNNKSASGFQVIAYDQDLRKKQLLGKAVTDTEGRYEISYTSQKFLHAEKSSADLFVVVMDAKGKELVSSGVLFNALSEAIIDLTLPPDMKIFSEFELLIEEIRALLANQSKYGTDLKISELEEKDIVFLSKESGQPSERIGFLLAAVKANREVGGSELPLVAAHVVQPGSQTIPVQAFYGWFRQGLPSSLAELLNWNADALRLALENSIRDNIIPVALDANIDSIFTHLQQFAVERLLKPGEPDGKASFGDLLRTVLPDLEKQLAIASLFISHHGSTEAFWKAFRETPDFNKEDIRQIQTTLQLGTLTGNHLPLVRELQRMGEKDPELIQLRGFAKLELTDWVKIIFRPQENGRIIGFPPDVQGENESVKAANYAANLNQFIEKTFPTAVIAHLLEKDNLDDSPFKQAKPDIKTFFSNNPDFEFGVIPVDLYLSQDRDKRLEGVKQPEELILQLKSIQRVFSVTPRFEEMRTLLIDDLHSAHSIVHTGKQAFVKKHR